MHDNPLFSKAADFVNHTSRHIFLTGKAGTGKTTFLKYIREHTRKKCVVVAPTGVAAINAGGVTMHSLFQLPLGPYVPVTYRHEEGNLTDKHTLFQNIRMGEEKRRLLRDLELLIIDEVSMVRCDMLDATDAILRHYRKSPHKPFGGVQVLYIGDLFQLPPVMPDAQWVFLREHYASPFFFHAKAVAESSLVYIELKKIYRQNEQRFIDILNRIRNNAVEAEDFDILNARCGAPLQPDKKYITLTTHNYKADRINADELKNLPGACREFAGAVEGDFPDKTLPTEMVLQLKEGAQVMFIRNDKSEERRYYNGKIAIVKKISKDGVTVVFPDSEDELTLEKETWENIRYSYNPDLERIEEEKLGAFTQYPVRLAWAITIHKSQGLTFQHAIIDAGESFAAGQVYVALSRCTSLDGLVLKSRILPGSISTDAEVISFASHEQDVVQLDRMLEEERIAFEHAHVALTFDLQKLSEVCSQYQQSLGNKKNLPARAALVPAGNMVREVAALQLISVRFQQQVIGLLKEKKLDQLRDRIVKGIDYFLTRLSGEILAAADQCLVIVKKEKAPRKLQKQTGELKTAVIHKMNEIGQVQYQGVPFQPERPLLKVEPVEVPAAKTKQAKGSSLAETLMLFRKGMSQEEISQHRKLARSTIEGHLAQLIGKGDISVFDTMEMKKVEDILAVIKETGGTSMQPVRQKMGDAVTFGEIRAVMNHLQYQEKQTG